MNKGTQASKSKAENAWSLLEDWSPYTQKGWDAERVIKAMFNYRKSAYDIVSGDSVLTCAHCAGVMLYCQFRGFGCAKEDFFEGGEANSLVVRTRLAAGLGSKIAYLVAGLWHQCQGSHASAIYQFQQCRSVPMSNLFRGDSHVAINEWREAYDAYNWSATKDKHFLGMYGAGKLLKLGWGCTLDVHKGTDLELQAVKLGYHKLVEAFYEGLHHGLKAPGSDGRRATRSGSGTPLSQNSGTTAFVGSAQPPSSHVGPSPTLSSQSRPQPLAETHYCRERWQQVGTEYGSFKKNETTKYRDAVCGSLHLKWEPVDGDGDCFFASVSKAMACLPKPIAISAKDLRAKVVAWLEECKDGKHGPVGTECRKYMSDELGRPSLKSVGRQSTSIPVRSMEEYITICSRGGVWVEGTPYTPPSSASISQLQPTAHCLTLTHRLPLVARSRNDVRNLPCCGHIPRHRNSCVW
jgi:hypothetical protein